VPRAPIHHVAIPPSDERPRLRLGGWRGQASPLVPPRRGVPSSAISTAVAWELPARAGFGGGTTTSTAGLRYRSRGHLLWPYDLHLRQCLSGRGRLTRLHVR
jgi:hypothetical protein